MNLKYIIPDVEATFGTLEFGGFLRNRDRRTRGQITHIARIYEIFSDFQKADVITVEIPTKIGMKNYDFGTPIKLVNPRIEVRGLNRGGFGVTDYVLKADDMVLLNEKD